jgi:hypothetical protein
MGKTKDQDWDDVYNGMVDQMKKNSKDFPNAVPVEQEDKEKKLEEKKKKKKTKKEKSLYRGWGSDYGVTDYASGGASDFGGFGDVGGVGE